VFAGRPIFARWGSIISEMKILSWNLNHRIQMKKIPDDVLSIIEALSPDIITLNEYVDGDEREHFKNGLNEIGFSHVSVSNKCKRQNQVLIASKVGHEDGDLRPPLYDEASISNFLHVIVPAHAIEVVGLRAPAYKKSKELKIYWSDLRDIFYCVATRTIVFIGDLNCDPNFNNTPGAKSLNTLCEQGWKLPIPSEPWSYISYNGQRHSKLDYALGSPAINGMSSKYISEVNSFIVAGSKDQNPLSDHAILLTEISPTR
jgi:hypothetical protein